MLWAYPKFGAEGAGYPSPRVNTFRAASRAQPVGRDSDLAIPNGSHQVHKRELGVSTSPDTPDENKAATKSCSNSVVGGGNTRSLSLTADSPGGAAVQAHPVEPNGVTDGLPRGDHLRSPLQEAARAPERAP